MTTPFSGVKHIHLTGIKGVAMTALAACLVDLEKTVEGSDVAEEFVTAQALNKLGVKILEGFSPEHIHANTDLLIYSGAHKGSQNPEVLAAKAKGIPVMPHAEALGKLMEGKIGISVCGVGGKSTVSAMIAWILEHAGLQPSFSVGVGDVLNFHCTGRYVSESKHFAAEADEYATDPGKDNTPRFMFQNPQVIVCTNLEYDHPDIYTSLEDTKHAYLEFFRKLPADGVLVTNGESEHLQNVVRVFEKERMDEGKTIQIVQIKSGDLQEDWQREVRYASEFGKTTVRFRARGKQYVLEIAQPGEFNALNGLYAVAAATHLGVSVDQALEAMKEFKGTMRRFEDKGKKHEVQYYDDYAHHPLEIQATLKALREWYPKSKIFAVFQPHTYSRTKSLLNEFSQAFHDADEVLLLDIFASAREAIDPTVSSDILEENIAKKHQNVKNLRTLEEVTSYLRAQTGPGDIVITLGAGDLYHVHDII